MWGVDMAKTEFLQIRLSPEDRAKIAQAAAAQHLDVSTWARQTLLRALDRDSEEELGNQRSDARWDPEYRA